MKVKLPFTRIQKILSVLSVLIAAGYFVYLALSWGQLEQRVLLRWEMPLTTHIEISYRSLLLAPPVLFFVGIVLVWRFSVISVSQEPICLYDRVKIEGYRYIRTALCSMNVLTAGVFWFLTSAAVNGEAMSWILAVFVIILLVLWIAFCVYLSRRFLYKLRQSLCDGTY